MQNWNEVPQLKVFHPNFKNTSTNPVLHYKQKWSKQKLIKHPPTPKNPTQSQSLFACLGIKIEDRLLTLLVAEGFRDGGAVTEIRPPTPLTGDLLSSLAEKKNRRFLLACCG